MSGDQQSHDEENWKIFIRGHLGLQHNGPSDVAPLGHQTQYPEDHKSTIIEGVPRTIPDTLLKSICEPDAILLPAYDYNEPDPRLGSVLARLAYIHRITPHIEALINDEAGEQMMETGLEKFLGWFFDYGPEMDEEESKERMRADASFYIVAWVASDGKVWRY